MRKIFVFLSLVACLHADVEVDKLKARIHNALPLIEGWSSAEKAGNFIDLVIETKPLLCVEIGTFGGSSLVPVASALKFLKQGKIITIDPWSNEEAVRHLDPILDAQHIDWWKKVDFNYIYSSYLHKLTKYRLNDYVTTLKMTSEEAASLIADGIDILYLDGQHSEYNATLDATLYLPKVRTGGYIWINDVKWELNRKALQLLSEQCTLIKTIDKGNCALFQKN